MELFDIPQSQNLSKQDIEILQQKQHEYYLLGTFLRRNGHELYGYDPFKDLIQKVEIKLGNTIHLIPVDGELIPIDLDNAKCMIDSRCIYFESLNMKNAIKRVNKWKRGECELFNLRKPSEEGIKFY